MDLENFSPFTDIHVLNACALRAKDFQYGFMNKFQNSLCVSIAASDCIFNNYLLWLLSFIKGAYRCSHIVGCIDHIKWIVRAFFWMIIHVKINNRRGHYSRFKKARTFKYSPTSLGADIEGQESIGGRLVHD